jgi:hypothetical protein
VVENRVRGWIVLIKKGVGLQKWRDR